MKCPICGGKETAPILYGMPVFDEELERRLRDRELVLGGCLVSPFNPQYHCFGCGENFFDPRDKEKRSRNDEVRKAHESRERSGE